VPRRGGELATYLPSQKKKTPRLSLENTLHRRRFPACFGPLSRKLGGKKRIQEEYLFKKRATGGETWADVHREKASRAKERPHPGGGTSDLLFEEEVLVRRGYLFLEIIIGRGGMGSV